MKSKVRSLFFSACILPSAAFAQATPQAEPARPSSPPAVMTSGVTGDWGGLRTRLFDAGLDFQAGYINQFVTNTQGGAARGSADNGQGMFGLLADMDKLVGLEGGKFRIFFIRRHGVDLNVKEKLGLIQTLQGVLGRGNILRLTEGWYEQGFDGGKVTLRIGRAPTGLEFATQPCDTENRSFCGAPPGNFPNAFTYWLNYPASTWMGRLKVNFGLHNDEGYIQAGVYQTNPKNADTTNGFRLALSGGTGVLIPLEAAWTPKLWTDRPGIYKLGGWYETSRTNDLFEDATGRPIVSSGLPGRPERGRYGVYAMVQQQITPSPTGIGRKGLSGFFTIFKMDKRTSIVDNYISAGLIQTGTFVGRPNDQVAIQLSRTHVNPRTAEADRILEQTDPLHGVRGSEYAAELDYRLLLTKGLKVTPNVQYIADPGGYPNHRNIVVLGVMTSLFL